MSLPIAFTATPHDAGTDNADAEDAFGQVATVTDANFEKINAWWRGQVATFTRSNQIVQAPTEMTPGDYSAHDFTPATWPPASIVLPARANTLLVGVGANVDYHGDSGTFGAVTMRISGGTSYVVSIDACRIIGHSTSGEAMTCMVAIPAAQLTPGGTVTLTPQYVYQSATVAARFRILDGSIWAVALT